MKNKKHIEFNPQAHSYTNTNSNQRYTSVTTKIGKHTPKFVPTESKTKYTQHKLGITHQQVIDMWELKNKRSQIRGNIIHEAIEDYLNGKSYYDTLLDATLKISNHQLPASVITKKEVANYLSYIVSKNIRKKSYITEDLLYSDTHKLAGQSDLVMFRRNKLWIVDWKTNQKELTFEGYKGEMMLPPFEKEPAGKLNVYRMQLNVYAHLAQQEYNTPVGGLMVVHFKDENTINEHVFEYDQNLVNKLLS